RRPGAGPGAAEAGAIGNPGDGPRQAARLAVHGPLGRQRADRDAGGEALAAEAAAGDHGRVGLLGADHVLAVGADRVQAGLVGVIAQPLDLEAAVYVLGDRLPG